MTHKVMLMTNNRPNLSNLDPAIRGRIVLIPFDMRWNRVSEADPDPTLHDADKDLAEKLWAEREGILRWLIAGAVDYQNNGLNLCSEVIESTINYLDKQDPFRRWFRTLTPCDPAKGQTASKLAQAFNTFRREEDEDASAYLSPEQLGRRLKQMGVKFKKTASGTQYGLQAPEEHEHNQGPKTFSETMTQVITGLGSEASGVDIAWWDEE